MRHLAHITLIVRDYDEALAFYVGKLGFELAEDTPVPEQDQRPSDPTGIAPKRWVTIRPPNAPPHATNILLARAATPHQATRIGDQTGGRVGLRCSPCPRHGCAPRSSTPTILRQAQDRLRARPRPLHRRRGRMGPARCSSVPRTDCAPAPRRPALWPDRGVRRSLGNLWDLIAPNGRAA